MSNSKSVSINMIYNSVFQILIYLIPLITTPYISRVLGADQVGKYSYCMANITYFSMFSILGSSMYGQRATAIVRENKQKLSEIFWNIFFFRLITTSIAIICYFIYLNVVRKSYGILEIVVTLNLINVVLDVTWFFQGLEAFKQTVLRGFFVKIVGLIGIFLFVKKPQDTWKYGTILLGSTCVGNLTMWFLLPKLIYRPQKIQPFFDFKNILLVFLPTIATQIYMVLDKTMIGWITKSDYANGCYEQSEKIVRVILVLISSIPAVILPRVSNLYHQGKTDEAKKYVYLSYRLVQLLAIPFMLGIIAVAPIFIPLYLGDGFEMAIKLTMIFSGLLLSVSFASVTGLSYLVATKQQNIYTISVSIAAVVNLAINSVLIPRTGAYGAAIASVIAEFVGAAIQILYCICSKQLELRKIFLPSWKYYISGMAMFIILMLLVKWVNSSALGVLYLVAIGGLSYIIMLFVLKDEMVISILIKAKKYLHL